jgi:hypothetical protein
MLMVTPGNLTVKTWHDGITFFVAGEAQAQEGSVLL